MGLIAGHAGVDSADVPKRIGTRNFEHYLKIADRCHPCTSSILQALPDFRQGECTTMTTRRAHIRTDQECLLKQDLG